MSFITGRAGDREERSVGDRFSTLAEFLMEGGGLFFKGMSNELRGSGEPARLILDYGATLPNMQACRL